MATENTDPLTEGLFHESEYFDRDVHSVENGISLQYRTPTYTPELAHFHPSIEINYLQNCDMTYSFSGREFELPRGRFCVFWAAHPHRKIRVQDTGYMTNVYVTLSEFMQWSLPSEFVNMLLSGAVLITTEEQDGDSALANRFAAEVDANDSHWRRLHSREMQARLHRMALEGWDVVIEPEHYQKTALIGGQAIVHFEKMLRFVALNFSSKIAVTQVADAAGISQSHAIALFKKMLGKTIMGHIRDMRIVHAKMLLVEDDRKILSVAMECGFGSLSTFYKCFHDCTGQSPAAFRKSPNDDIRNEPFNSVLKTP